MNSDKATCFLTRQLSDGHRLYVFPHSGSGPGAYLGWQNSLSGVQLIGVQYPGRGSRLSEPFAANVEALAEDIISHAGDTEFQGQFSFFGHSLGALVAYETAVTLARMGRPLPQHLIVSALQAPSALINRIRSSITWDDLFAMITEFSPELLSAVKNDPSLSTMLFDILSADINLIRTYEPKAPVPLPCSLSIMGGTGDDIAIDHLKDWQRYSNKPASFDLFAGGHFYFKSRFAEFADRLINLLKGDAPVCDSYQIHESSDRKDIEPGTTDEGVGRETHVAVIGIAGRFPGANSLEEYWQKLVDGQDFISRFTVSEAASLMGCAESEIGSDTILAYGLVPHADAFDRTFFKMSAQDAVVIDPQQRVFLETVWHALEDAGIDPARFDGLIGTYAGSGDTPYLQNLRASKNALPGISDWQMRLGNNSDFLCTRAHYHLDLRGPAVNIQSACSTSLVAVHHAIQALLVGDCDVALAGGATIYAEPVLATYDEGGILAPDGRCRPFDAKAKGTVASSGAGIVVLKRYQDAVRDGDQIYAVLSGAAVNNDGRNKVGFTAPSVKGQTDVIRAGLQYAGVAPKDIQYVEAHGTATALGDAIEMKALQNVFGACKQSIHLGSVKSAIGHTDSAAGIMGLIKTILAIRHGVIPPTLYFHEPNPSLSDGLAPFHINTRAVPWPSLPNSVRRACVSSFGLGGTNAHIVVESATETLPRKHKGKPSQHLIPLSAETSWSLTAYQQDLAQWLERHPGCDLDAVAWTSQLGRRQGPIRRCFAVESREELNAALVADLREPVVVPAVRQDSSAYLLFPGQGGQYVNMGRDLYEKSTVFRSEVDRCFAEFASLGLTTLKQELYPDSSNELLQPLSNMLSAQAALFSIEYSLAKLLANWSSQGFEGVIGHSLGAYAAACFAGVFSLSDACRIVMTRGRIFDKMPSGAMAAVLIDANALRSMLPPQISIAAINGPEQCVISGDVHAVDRFITDLATMGIDVKKLHIYAAAHSAMLDAYLAEFSEALRTVHYMPPTCRILSDRSGRWLRAEEAMSPDYWVRHLRETVNFDSALKTLLEEQPHILIEVGPSKTLSAMVLRHPSLGTTHTLQTLPHAKDQCDSMQCLYQTAAQFWERGGSLNWLSIREGRRGEKVSLPPYRFVRERFNILQKVSKKDLAPTGTEARSNQTLPSPSGLDAQRVAKVLSLASIQDIVAAVLGLDSVTAESNFFNVGGDSLLALQLCRRIKETFGIQVSPVAVFKAPTPLSLLPILMSSLPKMRTSETGNKNE